MEATRRESRAFSHLLNSAWDNNILSSQFEFIYNQVTPSASEAQEGTNPPFWRSRRESLLFSREILSSTLLYK